VALLLVILYFLILRSVRGNDRRVQALQKINQMFSAFWSIYTFLSAESRLKIRNHFIASFESVARNLSEISIGGSYWYAIMGLAPANRNHFEFAKAEEAMRLDIFKTFHGQLDVAADLDTKSKLEAVPAPRLQLMAALMLVEDENRMNSQEVDHVGKQNDSGHLWHSQMLLLNSYDELLALVIPSMGNAQIAFYNALMLVVSLILPWTFSPQSVHRFSPQYAHGSEPRFLAPMFFLCLNVSLIFLLHSFDVLAQMYDNPFAPSVLNDQICLEECVEVLSASIHGYDQRHHMAEQQYGAVRNSRSNSSSISLHSFICAQQKHKNVSL
jgi:hypothetical protein